MLTCGSPDKISVQTGLAIWKAFGLISMEERLSSWKGAMRARGSFTIGGKGHSTPWAGLYDNNRQQSLSLHIKRCLHEYSNKHIRFNYLWIVLTYNWISSTVNIRSSLLCHCSQMTKSYSLNRTRQMNQFNLWTNGSWTSWMKLIWNELAWMNNLFTNWTEQHLDPVELWHKSLVYTWY